MITGPGEVPAARVDEPSHNSVFGAILILLDLPSSLAGLPGRAGFGEAAFAAVEATLRVGMVRAPAGSVVATRVSAISQPTRIVRILDSSALPLKSAAV